jgi:hypothetical protein
MLLCVQGQFYQDMLAVWDLSTDVVPQQLTNATYTGGYGIVSVSWRAAREQYADARRQYAAV